MPTYAKDTEVSVSKSEMEVKATLRRYGAERMAVVEDVGHVKIIFVMNNRQVRIVLPLPRCNAEEFTIYYRGSVKYRRTDAEAERKHEQACRQRWRALALVIKAKLEAIECGISDFDTEFLPNIILPQGETVADFMKPQVEKAYVEGVAPTAYLLEGPKRG